LNFNESEIWADEVIGQSKREISRKISGFIDVVLKLGAQGAERRAPGRWHRQRFYFNDLRKFVIFLLNEINLGYIDSRSRGSIIFLLS